MIELETDRLLLRQWCPEDRAALAALNADPRVMACLPACLSRQESDSLAERFRRTLAQRGWGVWAVELKDTDEFIGFVGLNETSAELPFSPSVEILWRFAHTCWGRGLAHEAASAVLLEVAFGRLLLSEIVAFTSVHNERSQALMKRLGMKESGAFEHPALSEGHHLRQHVLYRLGVGDPGVAGHCNTDVCRDAPRTFR